MVNFDPRPLYKVPAETRMLVEKSCNGTLSDPECDRLNSLLRDEPETRAFYLAYLAVHARLSWEYGPRLPAEQVGELTSADIALAREACDVRPAPKPRGRQPSFRRWVLGGSAIAVAVAAVAVAVSWMNRPPDVAEAPRPSSSADVPSLPQPVATLSGSRKARWSDPAGERKPGQPLSPGRVDLAAGMVEITFRDGVVVLLEGPAKLDIAAQSSGFLHLGQAVVRLGGSSGFVLETESVQVKDLGTEFGVKVAASGETELQVFDGEVVAQLKHPAEGALAKRQVSAGQAVAVDAGRRVALREVAFAPDRFVRSLPPVRPDRCATAATAVPALPAAADPFRDAVLVFTFDRDTIFERDGQCCFEDQSGRRHHAKGVGAKWTADGVRGGACEFDGVDDYLDCGCDEAFNIKGPMTISLWVKLRSWDNWGGLCTKGNGQGGESWLLDMHDNKFRFGRRPAAGESIVWVQTPEPIEPDTWYHVVAVSDGQRLRLYVNLAETLGPEYAGESLVNDHVVTVGSRQGQSGPYDMNIAGVVDEVAIWARALSPEEIKTLFDRDKRTLP